MRDTHDSRWETRGGVQFGAIVLTGLAAAWATVVLPSAQAAPESAPTAPTTAPATQPSAVDRAVAAQLARKLPEVKFDHVGFGDAIDFLRDVSGANIVVDWRRLAEAKIDPGRPINLALYNVKFADALTRTLDEAGDKDHKPTYVSSEGVLVVSTPAGLDAYAAAGRAAAATAAADPNARLALDRRLPEAKFDGVGLSDVLAFMKNVTGLPVDADWKQLAAAGVDRDTRVTMRVYGVSVEQNLRLVLWSVGKDRPLTYAVRDGRIVVEPAAKAEPPK